MSFTKIPHDETLTHELFFANQQFDKIRQEPIDIPDFKPYVNAQIKALWIKPNDHGTLQLIICHNFPLYDLIDNNQHHNNNLSIILAMLNLEITDININEINKLSHCDADTFSIKEFTGYYHYESIITVKNTRKEVSP